MIERRIDVAGVVIRFIADTRYDSLLDRRYGAFSTTDLRSADATIELELEAATKSWVLGEQGLSVELGAESVVLAGNGMRAELTRDRRHAVVRAVACDRCVDPVLRAVLAAHLLRRQGLLLHASAIEHRERAWVFAGPSGAGKSTTATHLPGRLLCDEAVAVLSADGGVTAHATPYWHAVPDRAPVAAIAFLRRSGVRSLGLLSAARATAFLAKNAGPYLPSDAGRVLAVAAGIAQRCEHAIAELSAISDIGDWLGPSLLGPPGAC